MLTPRQWEAIAPENNPFLKYHFFYALLESGSIGGQSGWHPQVIESDAKDAALVAYVKDHSFGEFIFDWGWAEAFERYNIPYYPKLTSMVPFTPVTTRHFLMKQFHSGKARELLKKLEVQCESAPLSSLHFLFLHLEEITFFQNEGFTLRESIQFHFFNESFKSFEDYLSKMKTKKAKQVKKERTFKDLEITQYTGNSLTLEHARRMYQFYISTIALKNSFDYLNESFFLQVFETMKDHILYVEATHQEEALAGALFFYDSQCLYGRYWGARRDVENLHFELCYYQGIDFCIKNNIPVFEAGAQGEHKISRGFTPVKVFSAHKIKSEFFEVPIQEFIEREKVQVEKTIQILSQKLPWK